MKTFYPPTNPFLITQKFAEDLACWKRENGKEIIIARVKATCPVGYVSLYQASGMKGHNGLDIWFGRGQSIYASARGIVVEVSTELARGYGIGILTEDKFYSNETKTEERLKYRNWHMLSVAKRVGEWVEAGEYLGEADNTGYSSGDHDHFEVKPVTVKTETDGGLINILQNNGYFGAVDPMQFFSILKLEKPLEYGDESEDVRWLQFNLKCAGYFPKTQDCTGYYGNITQSSVFAWQKNLIKMSWYERIILKGSKFGDKSLRAWKEMYS